jgi:hypothetical protein
MSVAYPFIGRSLFFWTASGDLLFFIQAFYFSLLDTCATFPGTLNMKTTFQCVAILVDFSIRKQRLMKSPQPFS